MNPSKSISEANLGLRLIFSDLAITGARTLPSWADVAESMANGALACLAKINEMRGRFYAVAKAFRQESTVAFSLPRAMMVKQQWVLDCVVNDQKWVDSCKDISAVGI